MNYNRFALRERLVYFVMLLAFWPAFTASITLQENWVKLGDKTINYTVDHSEMVVDGISQNLSGLRVKVIKGAINLHRCVVHHKNGQIQEVTVLNSIPEGGESKIIEVSDTSVPVVKLVFIYDTKNRAIQKAEVELWGRRP